MYKRGERSKQSEHKEPSRERKREVRQSEMKAAFYSLVYVCVFAIVCIVELESEATEC